MSVTSKKEERDLSPEALDQVSIDSAKSTYGNYRDSLDSYLISLAEKGDLNLNGFGIPGDVLSYFDTPNRVYEILKEEYREKGWSLEKIDGNSYGGGCHYQLCSLESRDRYDREKNSGSRLAFLLLLLFLLFTQIFPPQPYTKKHENRNNSTSYYRRSNPVTLDSDSSAYLRGRMQRSESGVSSHQ